MAQRGSLLYAIDSIPLLYRELGEFPNRHLAGGQAGIDTANHEAAPLSGGDAERSIPLRNGSLAGRLYLIRVKRVGYGDQFVIRVIFNARSSGKTGESAEKKVLPS